MIKDTQFRHNDNIQVNEKGEMSIDDRDNMEMVSDLSDTDSGSETGMHQMEGAKKGSSTWAGGRACSNDELEELCSGSETETQHEDSREDREEVIQDKGYESAGSNMELDEDGDRANHDGRLAQATTPTQPGNPNASGVGASAGTDARGVLHCCGDVGEHKRDGKADDANGPKVSALPSVRFTSSRVAHRGAAASPSGARRPSPPRPMGQGNGVFIRNGAHPPSPAKLATSAATSGKSPSPSKGSAISDDVPKWTQRTGPGSARAVERRSKNNEDSRVRKGSFQSQNILTLGVPPDRRALPQAGANRGKRDGDMQEVRESSRGQGSLTEDREDGGGKEEEETQEHEGEGRKKNRARVSNLLSTQELLEDRTVKRLANRAPSTLATVMGRAGARLHETTSPSSTESPQGNSDDIFQVNDDEDSDDGRVLRSPEKRGNGSSRGRNQKKGAKNKAFPSRPAASSATYNGEGGETANRVRVRVCAPSTIAGTAATKTHGMPDPSHDRPHHSPQTCPQRARAMSSGSGSGSGRDDAGAEEEENAADVPVGAESANTSTSAPNRIPAAGDPALAIAEPARAPVTRPTRRMRPVRASAGGSTAAPSSLQGTGTASGISHSSIWRVLWDFLKVEEGWTFTKGKGLIDFIYIMPSKEGRPSMSFTHPDDVCAYARGNSDLFARFQAMEAENLVRQDGNGSGVGRNSRTGPAAKKNNSSKARETRCGAGVGAGRSIAASSESETDTDGEGNIGQPNGSAVRQGASTTSETRLPGSGKLKLSVVRKDRENGVPATAASRANFATANRRGPKGMKKDSGRDPSGAATAARRGPEQPRNKAPGRLSKKRSADGQRSKPIKKKRQGLREEDACQSDVAENVRYGDQEMRREEAANDYNLHQNDSDDSDDDSDRPIQWQNELQSALNTAQLLQERNVAAVATATIKASVGWPAAPARATPFLHVSDDRSGENRRNSSVESGPHPLKGVGVILTGCGKKYRRIVNDLGGIEIVFPPRTGANFLDFFSDTNGNAGARARDIDCRQVLAVATPASYRKAKYMFAVAARIDIVHPLYLDHIQGARVPADTQNYLLPIGRSALSDRSLIMPHPPTFGGKRAGGQYVSGAPPDDGPFQGKNVLIHGDRGYSPSWNLILWVAGACVTTIDAADGHLAGLPSNWPPVTDGDNVKYVSNCLRQGKFDFFISLDESGGKRSQQQLAAAACEVGVTLGSMEWASQCIAHGRILAPLADFCPWFPLRSPLSSSMEHCNGAAGEDAGSDAVGTERFFCLTRGGMRYVAGDYVLVNKPSATQAVVRVETFERSNNRVMVLVSKMESHMDNILSQIPGKTQVQDNWLGQKVLVIDQTSDLANRLYFSDPAVYFFV